MGKLLPQLHQKFAGDCGLWKPSFIVVSLIPDPSKVLQEAHLSACGKRGTGDEASFGASPSREKTQMKHCGVLLMGRHRIAIITIIMTCIENQNFQPGLHC